VKELQRRGAPNVVIALAANKADLEGKRKVSEAEGDDYAREHGIIHMQTSAKTGMNIKTLFVEIAKRLPKQPKPDASSADSFPIAPGPSNEKNGCC
jgi:Ras-related protein Rab-5C